MLQDSVPDGSLQWSNSSLVWFPWWLRHGAMDPSEGTLFRITVDWPDFWIYTFELVIRLSKVKQLAFPFCTISAMSRWSFGPRFRQNACLSERNRSEQPEIPFFRSLQLKLVTFMTSGKTVSCLQVWWLFLLMVVGEVKHIVRLIRWNLNSCLCPCGWPDSVPAREQRTTFRNVGIKSYFQCFSVFSPTSFPLVPCFMFSSLPS